MLFLCEGPITKIGKKPGHRKPMTNSVKYASLSTSEYLSAGVLEAERGG
jgi:hypothetical protein